MKKEEEVWEDIVGYEGLYQISSLGRVKSFNYHNGSNQRILTPTGNTARYLMVSLCKNKKKETRRIHQLVGETFLGYDRNNSNGLVIDHIDSNSKNNKVSNLRIVSQRENVHNINKKKTSNYLGVTKRGNKWYATIYHNKYLHLGSFDKEEDARDCYNNKLKEIINETSTNNK